MKRVLLIAAALASLAMAAPSPSQAATSVGFSLRIGDPYRGASVRFRSGPDWVAVPRTRVHYVRDYYDRDMYRYGGWIYLVDDGYWYRARSYRGPFIFVDFRSVPRDIRYIPAGYRRWDSRGYYGFTRDRYYYRHNRDWDRDRDYRVRDRYDRDGRYDRDRRVRDGDRDRRVRDGNRGGDWDWRNRDGQDRDGRDRDGTRDGDRENRDRDRDGDPDRTMDRDRDWNR